MTQDTTTPVEVTQADREAAAAFYGPHLARPGEVLVTAHMRAGKIDESALIQAFARHRLASTASVDGGGLRKYVQHLPVCRLKMRLGAHCECGLSATLPAPEDTAIKPDAGDGGVSEKDFNRGYLIAVANIMNLHDEEVCAREVLMQLGVGRSVLKGMDFAEYDLKPLRSLFREIERRAALSGDRA